MGLFSNLRRGGAAPKTEAIGYAVIAPAVVMLHADGKVDDSEAVQIANMCAYSPIFQEIGQAGTQKILSKVLVDLGKMGVPALLNHSAETLSPLLKETALMFAMRVALADGYLDPREKNVLLEMAIRFGVSSDNTAAMFEVVSILQRPATA